MYIKETTTDKLLSQLSKEHVNMVLVAEHSEINIQELIKKCKEADIRIAGAIFPKIVVDDKSLDTGAILKFIHTDDTPFLVRDLSTISMEGLPKLRDSYNTCIVLLDGLSASIPSFLGKIYDKYWNQISYIGGGAGSLSLKQQPCVFTNEGFCENAGILLMTPWQTKLGVKHGWEKIAGPFVANKTDGNKVIQINWRPAFQVYKEIVEQHTDKRFDEMDFFDIAKGFPFGIYRDGQEDIVRDPIAVEENGSLICVGKVEQNTSINILKGHDKQLIDNAQQASCNAYHPQSHDTLLVDCISRVLYLEDRFDEELQAVKKGLKVENGRLEGILSLGEISSDVNGYLEFFNKTTVASSFY